MINIAYPLRFDSRGRTTNSGWAEHIREMIEEFLFTSPGERVNRLDFGAGLLRMVFEPNGQELASALQFTIKAGLERWLGDLIEIELLEISSDESFIQVVITYRVRATGEQQIEIITNVDV